MKSIRLKLSELIDFIGAKKIGPALIENLSKQVPGISTDSRTIEKGQIFFALVGPNFNGHDHLAAALEKGASAIISQEKKRGALAAKTILVENTQKSLEDLAAGIRQRQNLKVIAVTGSNGKTSTKEMLGKIFQKQDPLITKGNFNNQVGLPLTIFRVEKNTKLAILEMGMNHFGEIKRLTEIAKPDVGLITSLSEAHLEYFGSLRNVAKAKGELYANLPLGAVAVVNSDDVLLMNEAKKFSGPKLFFGQKQGDVRLGNWRSLGLAGQSFKIFGPGLEKGFKLKLKLLGFHNAQNALASAAAALAAGAGWDEICSGLMAVESFPGRLAVQKNNKGHIIIDDSYNANPTSMTAALHILSELKGVGLKVALLGDMLELGPKAVRLHRQIGRLAASLNLDYLLAVGEYSKFLIKAASDGGLKKDRALHFENVEQAVARLSSLPKKTAILFKGSRGMRLDLAVKKMLDI